MRSYRERFVEGAVSEGVAREVAERVFEQVRGFSGFGFPKSHAAAFGLLAYQSTWLRVHYGPEFLCALLNEQPMGFYPPDALVHEAQRRGIDVRGPDVNAQQGSVPGRRVLLARSLAVRIGLGYVKGLAERDAEIVVAERERGGAYRDLGDLASRSGASREGLEMLAWAGACAGIGGGSERQRRGSATRWRAVAARRRPRLDRASGEASSSRCRCRPRGSRARDADAVGAGERRLRGLRDVAGRAPARAAPSRRWPRDRHLRGARADPRRHRADGRRDARRPPAAGHGEGGDVPAARGRVGRGERDRPAAGLRAQPPASSAPPRSSRSPGGWSAARGSSTSSPPACSGLERPDMPLAEVRTIEPPADRETGRTGAELADLDAVLPAVHSFGRRGR